MKGKVAERNESGMNGKVAERNESGMNGKVRVTGQELLVLK